MTIAGELTAAEIRANLIARVLARRRLGHLIAGRPRRHDLVSFHTAHKFTLLAHSPTMYGELGRLVARIRRATFDQQVREYGRVFMAALSTPATRPRHVNVLQHAAGHTKLVLPVALRRDLALTIAGYQTGALPLIAPIRLLSHYIKAYHLEYLANSRTSSLI